MRTWIRRTLLGLLGAGVLFGGLAACSHHGHREGWSMSAEDRAKHREKILARIAGRLDLDAGQKQKLEVLADRLMEQRNALRGTNAYPLGDVKSLVAGEKFDRAKAQSLVGEKVAAVQAKSPEVIAALGDFYDSLNAAQQAKVREFMDRRPWWRRG